MSASMDSAAELHASVRRSPVSLQPDRSRTVARLFVPGREAFDRQESRTSPVLERVLALDDGEIAAMVDDLRDRFSGRHRDLDATWAAHADQLADRLDPQLQLSADRRLMLGAAFTSEHAVEGAALCNPSIVEHPDQHGLGEGDLRVVLSVRAIGEGHLSTLGFRTGVVTASGEIALDPPPRWASLGTFGAALLATSRFRVEAARHGLGRESTSFVLDALPPQCSRAELETRLDELLEHSATRADTAHAVTELRRFAERTYATSFPDGMPIAERVLWPAMAAERNGIEDARFVRFVDDDDSWSYAATYTAYDGADIRQQLLQTRDFSTFTASPLVGSAAANKGLALFPRRVGGRFAAMSRADRETNSVAFSDDIGHWDRANPCQAPTRPWETIQLGNCGSPIETDAGWLVLTHGVGPMREYAIGAVLLDLDDPTRLIGSLAAPLLRPAPDEQAGYVPNVVYSCGGLVHADMLVLPYGIGDVAIGFATVPLRILLAALLDESPR